MANKNEKCTKAEEENSENTNTQNGAKKKKNNKKSKNTHMNVMQSNNNKPANENTNQKEIASIIVHLHGTKAIVRLRLLRV